MRFKDPAYFLLIIPAIVWFWLYVRHRIGKEAVLTFSSVRIVKEAGAKAVRAGRILSGFLRLMAMILVVSALARPQTGTGEEKTTEHVVDIMLALDISGSMATLDFYPDNRLVAAKRQARRFIEGRKYDRIGLVVFSGQSITQSPLTVDRQALFTLLERTRMGLLADGTAIGLGLANAVNRLKDSEARSKVIILLTDGINNAGEIDPPTAGELAKQFGIRVYTIGVGKEGEAILPVEDPRFGTRLIKVRTEIDEESLNRISLNTGGRYFRAENERGLNEIFGEIDRLEKTEITVERLTHFEEQYFWFLWPALYLLLIELAWSNLIQVKIP